jgi:hypothetical protein
VTAVTIADHIEFEMLMPLGLGISPNQLGGKWQKRNRINGGIRKHVADVASKKLARLQLTAPARKAKLQLTLIWPSSKRVLEDHDNLLGRLKPVVDGLRDAHVLVNDSPAWLEYPAPIQVKSTVAVLTLRVVIDYAGS